MNHPTFIHPLFSLQQETMPKLFTLKVQFHEPQPTILILLKRESLLSFPSPSRSTKQLSLSILPGGGFSTGSWVHLPAQYSSTLQPSSYLFHELFSFTSQQNSTPGSTRFLVGKRWKKGSRSTLSNRSVYTHTWGHRLCSPRVNKDYRAKLSSNKCLNAMLPLILLGKLGKLWSSAPLK